MRRRRLFWAGVLALVLFLCWFCITSYLRGRADFDAVSEGKAPIYATHYAYLLDGGSEWFRGRGYSIYRVHRILLASGHEPPEGHLGGAEITWSLPVRIFAEDDDSYHYIPGTK